MTPGTPEGERPSRPNELLKRMGVDKPEEAGITDPRLQKFVNSVGRLDPDLVDPEDIRLKYLGLNKIQEEAAINSEIKGFDDDELDVILGYLGQWYKDLRGRVPSKSSTATAPTGIPDSTASILQQQLDIQKRQLQVENQEAIAGRDAAFINMFYQGAGNPELSSEVWYVQLTKQEQIILNLQNRFLFALTGTDTAPGKKGGPAKGFETYKAFLHIRKEELECLFESTGFKVAFGTIRRDLFELGELNPSPSAGEIPIHGLVLSNEGKRIIQDQDKITKEQVFTKYREDTIKKIEVYLHEHPEDIGFGLVGPHVPETMINKQIRIAAEGYFGMAWNFWSVGMAIESGDVSRKVSNSDPSVIVPGWRNLIHPHNQAINKWVRNESEKVGTEEDLFGILGRWFQERIRHDPNFKDRFQKYEPGFRYFQKVVCGSMFDHSYFSSGKTMAEVFCNDSNLEKVVLANGEVLYKFDQPSLDFSKLNDADMGATYSDILDSVVKIQAFITTPEAPKDPVAMFAIFVGAVLALQGKAKDIDPTIGGMVVKDRVLNGIYDPSQIEELVLAGIGASGGGFKQYTNKLMLETGGVEYDSFIYRLLLDDRIFKILGEQPGSTRVRAIRDNIYKRINAHDINTYSGARASTKDAALMGGPRTEITKEIMNNRKKWGGR
jgi:hypothetical protein